MNRQPRKLTTRKLAISGLSGRKVLIDGRHVGNVWNLPGERLWSWSVIGEPGRGALARGAVTTCRNGITEIKRWIDASTACAQAPADQLAA